MVSSALDAMAGTAWGRWLGLVAAVWVQCISGNNYTFSNYSDSIKTLMGLTQLQLNGLSVAKDVGKAFGLLAGLASDRVPTWLLLAIGSLEGFLGYGAQWLVVSRTVSPLPYWQMCVCLCLGGNSTTWMNTAVLVTCIRNFRGSRGPVSGVLKGFVGLSTAIFTDLCSALFADDPASFLVMLAVVPAAVCAVAMVFLREGRVVGGTDDEADARGFAAISTLAVAIALYLLAADLTGIGSDGGPVSVLFVTILLVLLAAPIAVPALVGWRSWMKTRKAANADAEEAAAAEESTAPLLLASKPAEARGPGERPRHLHPQLPRQQGPCVGGAQGLRGPQHGHLHRPLLCALRRRPGLVPRHARRHSRRRLRRRHGVPPRGPRRGGHKRRGRRARVRGNQHTHRRHRALPPRRRPHRHRQRRRARLDPLHHHPPSPPRGPHHRARARGVEVLDEDPQGV